MKRLVSYLLIYAIAAIYAVPAGAASTGRRVSLSYEANLSLSIPAPGTYSSDSGILYYLPVATPASLLDNDYEIILRAASPSVALHAGLPGIGYESGWKIVNTDPRLVRLQPTYFWSGNEIGIRANIWSGKFLVLTYKLRF